LARMCGITPNNPIGTGWEIAIGVSDVNTSGSRNPEIYHVFFPEVVRIMSPRVNFINIL